MLVFMHAAHCPRTGGVRRVWRTQIPVHSGYKSEKAKPWTKAKTLNFDEKMEAKAEGDLHYGEMRRAKWYALEIPAMASSRSSSRRLPGEATNEDFDLAIEILDPASA